VFVAFLLAACTGENLQETSREPTVNLSSAGQTESGESGPSAGPSTSSHSTVCPVTLPNGDNPPGQRSRLSHGNGRLWVALYPRGIIRARRDNVQPNGDLAFKFPWTRGVKGQLTITGRRLDAAAPPVRSWIPKGYGRSGFQSSAVIFPTAGCWEVTGHVGSASLTVVASVRDPVLG